MENLLLLILNNETSPYIIKDARSFNKFRMSAGNEMTKLHILFLCSTLNITANNIELTVSGAQQTQMPLAIMILNETHTQLNTVATTVKKDLQFTDQFTPCIKKYNTALSTKEIRKQLQQLAHTGVPLALCLSASSKNIIEWRLYDTTMCTMLQGKKYKKKGTIERGWAHTIADGTWKTLTGNDGFFSSKIAYCKNSQDKGKNIRNIYIADFDGSNEELLVTASAITVAPRWHTTKPELFYSEYTDTNVQLMSTSLKKKRKTVSALEGINMLASFADNGKDYVYCASHGNGSCQIYLNKNDTVKRCTRNTGNNTSPLFMDKERICFCSDFQKGNPQIYIGNTVTGHLQRITKGGYCTSPSYCSKNDTIAYHKMIQGTMQIMLYDCATKTHTQFTNSPGNKHEVSWSPDGTRLLYSHEQNATTSRLASSTISTNKTQYLTSDHDYCSYPHWSPCYQIFPVVS
jgi:TolB protein